MMRSLLRTVCMVAVWTAAAAACGSDIRVGTDICTIAEAIRLAGHGATLDGSEPLDPAAWREAAPGLFANDNLLPELNTSIIDRWFFLWDGRMNHMGRTAKGSKAPIRKHSGGSYPAPRPANFCRVMTRQ